MTDGARVRGTVLLTGAFGNVGRYTVRALLAAGHHVVASDVHSEAAERDAREFARDPRFEVRWTDLTDADSVTEVVRSAAPEFVVHLAAFIPPSAYARPGLAWAVNVDGTRHLVDALVAHAPAARLVHVSSIGVHGSRNPHTLPVLDADSPVSPCDVYGATKAAAEDLVTASGLDWVVLRLAAVIFPDMRLGNDPDGTFLEAILPADGRVQTVDVRDVATACVSAGTAECTGRVLLIGGDRSHRHIQAAFARDFAGALGLRLALPTGLPGDPSDDDAWFWFVVDWVDTEEAQTLLRFQHHTWSRTRADLAASVGRRRHLLTVLSPLARVALTLRSPRRGRRMTYADPWVLVEERWGPDAVATERPLTPART